jgi:hypothetical protein
MGYIFRKWRDRKDDISSFQTYITSIVNLILILKELVGDYRVTTNHLSMQFKMLFRDVWFYLIVGFGLFGLVTS